MGKCHCSGNYSESARSKFRELCAVIVRTSKCTLFPPDNGLSPHGPSPSAQGLAQARCDAGWPWRPARRRMPEARCCWVSAHYLLLRLRGQGGIHDALLFMLGGISGVRNNVSDNVATSLGCLARPASVQGG